MTATLLTLAVLAAFVLIGVGGWRLAKRQGKPLNAGLMIGIGVVLLINVWINSIPIPA